MANEYTEIDRGLSEVQGRLPFKPHCPANPVVSSIKCNGVAMIIRLDDKEHPEFWMSIAIPYEVIVEARVAMINADDVGEDCQAGDGRAS